jgi:predicted DNA-binding transcriptional regulator YafY
MRRASRLLAFVQLLRRHRRPVTAGMVAEELEVSERTVYRDVVSLQASGVPVRGEAGIGYVLEAGFDLPPLMFSADELEAVMLGLRFARERGDAALARAADDAVAKIEAVLPAELRTPFIEASLFAPHLSEPRPERVDVAQLRRAIRSSRKVEIVYANERGDRSTRRIWPIALGYFERACVAVAWCELRREFHHFRTDRIERLAILEARYPEPRSKLLATWQRSTKAAPRRVD